MCVQLDAICPGLLPFLQSDFERKWTQNGHKLHTLYNLYKLHKLDPMYLNDIQQPLWPTLALWFGSLWE
jgi:hypothetical protein